MFGCNHNELTFLTIKDVAGVDLALAFCCKCGCLRQYEKLDKDYPIRQERMNRKYIEKHPESGSYRSGPPVFEE